MSFSLKISILLLYRRIFFVVPTFTRVCNVLIIIITAIHLAGFTSGVFLCMPISYFWKQAIPPGYPGAPTHRGRCQNYQVAWLVLGSFNVITDLIAVVLPLPVLGRLRITAARRASLIFIFALSSVPVIASLLRIRPLARIPGGNDDPLFSQHVWELQLYCGIEISVGITCACLPTLSPLATRMCPKMMASLGGVVSDPIDHAAGSGSGGGGWRGLKSRKASDDAAMNADADGGFINSVATIGGTSARSGRKGSVGKGRGRKRSDATAYSDISTIMTDDESTETKTTATVVPRELEHDVEDQIPLSPKDKTDTDKAPLEKAKEHSKKKNALGLRLWDKDKKPWTSNMASALTPKQQRRQKDRHQGGTSEEDKEKWRLSPLPLPSPSFRLSMMLSPKTTSATTTQAVWAARMSEVIAVPVSRAANSLENEKDGAVETPSTLEAEADHDDNDRSRQRTRPPASSQRRRSSRSLDWQAAEGIRTHTRNEDDVDVDAADQARRDSGSTAWQWPPRRNSSRASVSASGPSGLGFSFAFGSPLDEKGPHPHPHPLHSHPQNAGFSQSPSSSHPPSSQPLPSSPTSPSLRSPTHSLPSPSIYSRASIATTAFTLPYRRPSVDHFQQHHHHRRPSLADSMAAADFHRRPSAAAAVAEAYATIVEDDDGDVEDMGDGPSRGNGNGEDVDVASPAAAGQQTPQWWTTLRKGSNATSVTLVREEDEDEWARVEAEARGAAAARIQEEEEIEEEEGEGWRRGSVVSVNNGSGLRRRPVSWTADWGGV